MNIVNKETLGTEIPWRLSLDWSPKYYPVMTSPSPPWGPWGKLEDLFEGYKFNLLGEFLLNISRKKIYTSQINSRMSILFSIPSPHSHRAFSRKVKMMALFHLANLFLDLSLAPKVILGKWSSLTGFHLDNYNVGRVYKIFWNRMIRIYRALS